MKQSEATTIGKRNRGIGLRTQEFIYPTIVEATTMSCKIEFDRDFDYVSLSVRGALNMSQVRVCRNKLQEVLRVYDRTRVLLDTTNVIARLTALEDCKFIKELSDGFLSNVSIALIVSRQRVPFGLFIDTTAVNNGVRSRTFTDKKEALAWLMKQPSGVSEFSMCQAS